MCWPAPDQAVLKMFKMFDGLLGVTTVSINLILVSIEINLESYLLVLRPCVNLWFLRMIFIDED